MYITAVFLALAAATIYGFLGICVQIAGERRMGVFDFMFYKQFLGFILGLLFSSSLGLPLFRSDMALLGTIGAVFYLITLGAYLMATREREIAASWTVLNLSVVLPIAFSVFWFGDPFTLAKGLGVILTLLSIFFIGGGFNLEAWKRMNLTWFKWILTAFLLNGWLVVLFRFVKSGEGPLFTTYFYGISFLIVAILYLCRQKGPPLDKTLLWVSAGGAVTHWSGIVLTILALDLISPATSSPGVIIYPITNGLVIPIGAVLGIVILKQKTDKNVTIGVVLGMVALILFFI